MKKTYTIILLALCALLLFSSVSCKDVSAMTLHMEGNWVNIDNNNRIRSVSSEFTRGKAVIKMELDFSSVTLEELGKFTFSLSEVGRPNIEPDLEAGNALNTGDYLHTPYKGEIYLVFEDNSIFEPSESFNLYDLNIGNYHFAFIYGDATNAKND